MYKVAVVLYEGCYLSSLTGPIDAFQIANAHIKARKGNDLALFSWQTVSMEAGPVETSGGFKLSADVTIDNAEHFDFIYIPAFLYKGSIKSWITCCKKWRRSLIGYAAAGKGNLF